jgi:transcriptional regulator with XRE-family HTH domain
MNDTGTAVSTPKRGPDLSHSPARMKRKRFEAGLGLCEAAKLAGRSPAYLSEIEHGKYSPRPGDLARFAELYDCKIADFLPPERIAA